MISHLYIFKASGLQNFIFGTQPLREAIGASQIIIDLTDKVLTTTLQKVGAQEDYKIIQSTAGSAIIEFFNPKTLADFYAIWPLIVGEVAPGLEVHQWSAPRGKRTLFQDLQAGWDALRERRNQAFAPIPEVPPLARRSPDSGEGAVGLHPDRKIRKANPNKVVDLASLRKLAASHRQGGSAGSVSPGEVKEQWIGAEWETELPEIADKKDSFIAVIHADGNRIGGFLIELANSVEESDLGDDAIAKLYQRFSKELNESTRRAVIDGLKELTGPKHFHDKIPARPVVIGGDDVSLIVPAKDALKITERFLERFASYTEAMLDGLRRDFPQLSALRQSTYQRFTACAGIVFQKHKFPLLLGYDYAERLCSFAKKESVQPDGTTTSSLIFTRHLDSDATDFLTRQAESFIDPCSQIRLSAGPYAIEEDSGLITVVSLRKVADALKRQAIATNTARDIIDKLQISSSAAELVLKRAETFVGDDFKPFIDLLDRAREQRTKADSGFKIFSILPDASILERMETP